MPPRWCSYCINQQEPTHQLNLDPLDPSSQGPQVGNFQERRVRWILFRATGAMWHNRRGTELGAARSTCNSVMGSIASSKSLGARCHLPSQRVRKQMDGGWGVRGGLADRQRAQTVTHAELSDSHQRAGPIATIWHLGPGHHRQPGRPFISKEMYSETEWCFFLQLFLYTTNSS